VAVLDHTQSWPHAIEVTPEELGRLDSFLHERFPDVAYTARCRGGVKLGPGPLEDILSWENRDQERVLALHVSAIKGAGDAADREEVAIELGGDGPTEVSLYWPDWREGKPFEALVVERLREFRAPRPWSAWPAVGHTAPLPMALAAAATCAGASTLAFDASPVAVPWLAHACIVGLGLSLLVAWAVPALVPRCAFVIGKQVEAHRRRAWWRKFAGITVAAGLVVGIVASVVANLWTR
jgi:hypothetical protein